MNEGLRSRRARLPGLDPLALRKDGEPGVGGGGDAGVEGPPPSDRRGDWPGGTPSLNPPQASQRPGEPEP